MKLTIALCTYNPKPLLLRRVVDAILPQMASRHDVEFMVIDNNSSPSVQELGVLAGLPLRILREPRQGLTAAREAAIANAQGELILFVDDDNILDPGYLDRVIESFADEKLGLLGGAIYPEYEAPPPKWFLEYENLIAIRRYPSSLRVTTADFRHSDFFPVGAGFAVRRSLARSYVEDCDRDIRIEGRKGAALSSGEDIDLALYVLSQGYSLMVTGALRLLHVIPSGRVNEAYIRRLARSGLVSSAEIEKKWSKRSNRGVFPLLAWPRRKVQLRRGIFWLLSPLSPKYRIKREIFSTLLKLQHTNKLGSVTGS